jgi:hypothetical protein
MRWANRQTKGLTFIETSLQITSCHSRVLCCAKVPFSFEVGRYDGQPTNQPFNLYITICLRGAARNRWARDRGRDELGTDRNQRILPELPLLYSRKPSTTTQEIERIPLCLCPRVDSGVTFGVVCHRVSSGRELLSVAPALQSSEQSALHAAILSHRYS